jgi:ketosteroid isomerase-like protein
VGSGQKFCIFRELEPVTAFEFQSQRRLQGKEQVLWAAGAWSGAIEQMEDVYAINLAKTNLREGFNEGDVERVLSVYDDAFVDMSFGMPSFYYSDAKDVFRARLMRLFRDYTVCMKMMIIDVVLNGNWAFDWGWHVLDLTSKADGSVSQIRTRYFETWRRDAIRGWVIASFIDNLDQTPRLPDELIDEIATSEDTRLVTRLTRDLLQFAVPSRR